MNGSPDASRGRHTFRALWLLSLVICLAIAAATAVLILDLRERSLAQARGDIVSLSRVLSDQTTRTFDGVLLTMRAAREHISADLDNRLVLDDPSVHLLLQARVTGLPQVKSMFLADGQGRGINSSRPDFIRNLLQAERSFFRYHANGGPQEIFISPAEKARVDNEWTYYVSIPLRDAGGVFRGIIAAAIRIDYFEALYEAVNLHSVSQVLLLNSDGTRLAGTPHDESRFGQVEGNAGMLKQLSVLAPGSVVETSETLPQGRRFAACRDVVHYPLVVCVAVVEKDALAPHRHVVRLIAAGAALLLIFIAAATLLIAEGLRRKGLFETMLKERDDQMRHMVQSVRDAIITAAASRRIVLFNSAAESLLGISAQDAIGRPLEGLLSRRLRQPQLSQLLDRLEEGWRSPTSFTLLADLRLRREERQIPVEISVSSSLLHGEMLLTAVFRDLTESQRTAGELLETNRQLQELSVSLQCVREEERTLIARDLHDELGQSLTGLRMEVSWLLGRSPPEQQPALVSIKGQIDQTIATVRRISSELRPLMLDDLGLSAAASWYVNQFSVRTGIPVRMVLPDHDPAQGGAVAAALFRVLQESLTNVVRHAAATSADVRLSLDGENWRLRIADDGCGFVHDPSQRRSLGLIGMRERVAVLGGTFSVTTAPGSGTVIEVVVPVEKSEECVE